jgi:hypothetical protein
VAAAPDLLAEHAPLTALACWFDRVASYARVKRGVFAAVEVILLIGYLTRLDQAEWDTRARPLLEAVVDGLRRPVRDP